MNDYTDVKTTILSTIAHITKAQNIFPTSVFSDSTPTTLHPFCKSGKVISWEAYSLFAWLQDGTFPSLEEGVLDSITFAVQTEPKNPAQGSSVLQTWTFALESTPPPQSRLVSPSFVASTANLYKNVISNLISNTISNNPPKNKSNSNNKNNNKNNNNNNNNFLSIEMQYNPNVKRSVIKTSPLFSPPSTLSTHSTKPIGPIVTLGSIQTRCHRMEVTTSVREPMPVFSVLFSDEVEGEGLIDSPPNLGSSKAKLSFGSPQESATVSNGNPQTPASSGLKRKRTNFIETPTARSAAGEVEGKRTNVTETPTARSTAGEVSEVPTVKIDTPASSYCYGAQ